MRLPPQTILVFCTNSDCVHARGIHVRWVPDSDDGPGWPRTDSCPACRADLQHEPFDGDAARRDIAYFDALNDAANRRAQEETA